MRSVSLPARPRLTYAVFPSGVIAMYALPASDPFPYLINFPALFVAVLTGVTVPELLAT